MVERDLHELLTALEVDSASNVVVSAASPEWAEGEWTDYRCSAASASVEVAITDRECDVLLAAGAASGESRPLAGG